MDNPLLKKEIIELIQRKGKITFADFMDMALYHPEYGYYTSEREKLGKEGDFYTSTDVHPVFGGLIARQMEQMWKIMGCGKFTIVELGAGKGWLCHDILSFIKERSPEFYKNVEYKIVEISKYHIEKQSGILKDFEDKIVREQFSDGKFSFGPIEGCYLSNEFFDSLPVHSVVVEENTLKEIFVTTKDGVLVETTGCLSTPELEEYFHGLNINLNEGQKAEVNLKAIEWIKNISRCLKRGFAITIDYGHPAEGLYSDIRSRGTLMCYYKHTTNESPLERIGNQDITAHVNFTSLMKAGEEEDIKTTGLAKQSHFLITLGILDEMNRSRNDIKKVLTMKNLIIPGGMGDTFKILIQHKGIDSPELIGLRDINNPELASEIEGTSSTC